MIRDSEDRATEAAMQERIEIRARLRAKMMDQHRRELVRIADDRELRIALLRPQRVQNPERFSLSRQRGPRGPVRRTARLRS